MLSAIAAQHSDEQIKMDLCGLNCSSAFNFNIRHVSTTAAAVRAHMHLGASEVSALVSWQGCIDSLRRQIFCKDDLCNPLQKKRKRKVGHAFLLDN